MPNEQLLVYIRSELAKGTSRDELVRSLLATGWRTEDINTALDNTLGNQELKQVVAAESTSTELSSIVVNNLENSNADNSVPARTPFSLAFRVFGRAILYSLFFVVATQVLSFSIMSVNLKSAPFILSVVSNSYITFAIYGLIFLYTVFTGARKVTRVQSTKDTTFLIRSTAWHFLASLSLMGVLFIIVGNSLPLIFDYLGFYGLGVLSFMGVTFILIQLALMFVQNLFPIVFVLIVTILFQSSLFFIISKLVFAQKTENVKQVFWSRPSFKNDKLSFFHYLFLIVCTLIVVTWVITYPSLRNETKQSLEKATRMSVEELDLYLEAVDKKIIESKSKLKN